MVAEVGRIGLWVSSRGLDPSSAEHRKAVTEIDDLGFGALWLGSPDGELELAAAGLAASSRLVVATGIVNIWLTAASDLAAAYRRVSHTYPERFLLGIGSSHAPPVESAGQRYAKPYSRLAGYLDELDDLPEPIPHGDLVLAALGPRTVALAGTRTAGAHPYLTTPEHTRQAREILGAGPLLAPEQKVVLDTDPDSARSTARAGLELYLGLPNYLNNLRRLGFDETDFDGGGSNRLVDALVAWGDLDAVRRRVHEHLDAGADHVCLRALTGSGGLPMREWRRLADGLLR